MTACFADGTIRDVTHLACYEVSDPTRASISATGRVSTHRPCETAVSVRFMNGRAISRLAFPAVRPDFVWRAQPENGPIDTLVFAKLKALAINPSPLATDAVFLRRAYLDAIGRLPDPGEARAFLSSRASEKRAWLDRPTGRTP